MVDLNPYVSKILRKIAPVELAGSDSGEKYPCIVIEQYGNITSAVIDGKEYLSDVNIQTDVYGCTPKERSELAEKVARTMTEHGFVRTAGKAMGAKRFMMTFHVKVDEFNKHFYQ